MPVPRLSSRLERLAGSRLSRRGTLTATALGLLTPLLGDRTLAAKRRAFDTAASAPPPLPSVSPVTALNLSACSPEVEHYCVETFTVGGVDVLASPPPDTGALVSLGTQSPDGGVVDRFDVAFDVSH